MKQKQATSYTITFEEHRYVFGNDRREGIIYVLKSEDGEILVIAEDPEVVVAEGLEHTYWNNLDRFPATRSSDTNQVGPLRTR